MLGKFITAGIITAAVIGTTTQIVFPPKPVIFYNPSPSAKVGFYKLTKEQYPRLGVQVAAYAPEWARKMADERGYLPYDYPLIKSVIAVHGDEICYHKMGVSVPDGSVITKQVRDRQGREMPVQSGCVVLKADEYFLISPDVQAGFDSRYFGPVRIENILGTVIFVGKTKTPNHAKKLDLVGFEG